MTTITNKKHPKVVYGGWIDDEPLNFYKKVYPEAPEFDTARPTHGSEEKLGNTGWSKKLSIATKVFPLQRGGLKPENIEASLETSLKELQLESVDLFYIHWPDRSVSPEVFLPAIDELHKAGKFKEFGLSNYSAWEVAQICEVAERLGTIKPTVYQGVYNLIDRSAEDELFPCLKKYGIRFYAYSPLAGGLLSTRYTTFTSASPVIEGSRFDRLANFKQRYWRDSFFDALRKLSAAAERAGCNIEEASYRWLNWHSKLDAEKGDGYILGSSRKELALQNIEHSTKGPLPDEVAKALEGVWSEELKGVADYYYMPFSKLVMTDP